MLFGFVMAAVAPNAIMGWTVFQPRREQWTRQRYESLRSRPQLENRAHAWAHDESLESSNRCVSALEKTRETVIITADGSVFVKGVVRQVHAASLVLRAPVSRSGFSQTGPTGAQLRGCPDHRSGLAARAFVQRQARAASTV